MLPVPPASFASLGSRVSDASVRASISVSRSAATWTDRAARDRVLAKFRANMGLSSMINWEEFGRSQLAQTVLNLSQLG